MSRIQPVVSVIIPCYRGERFIMEAIDSVLSQADDAVEVLVVDDGSPDRSAELVAAAGDRRVQLLRHEGNRGIAAARNTGLARAQGEFIAFLDQDDLWRKGRLEAQLRVLRDDQAGNVVLVFCDTLVRDEAGREWRGHGVPPRVREFPPPALLAALVREKFVILGAALIRRRALLAAGTFDESIRGGSDDFDMLVRLAERGAFAHVPEPLFLRRLHAANYTSAELMIEESLVVIDRVGVRHPGLGRAVRIGRARKFYRRASDALVIGAHARARADYARALRAWPWQPRAWLGLALCAAGPVGRALLAGWRRMRGERRDGEYGNLL